MMVFAINGSHLINNPFNTTFQAYTNLLGPGVFLIVLVFISLALYLKTKNGMAVGAFIMVSSLLLMGGGIYASYPEMGFVFAVFFAFGFVGTFLNIYFNRRNVIT